MSLIVEAFVDKHKEEIRTYSMLSKYYKDILRNKRPMREGDTRSMLDSKYCITKLKLTYLYYSYTSGIPNHEDKACAKACVKAVGYDSILNVNNLELIKYIKDIEDFKVSLIHTSADAVGDGIVVLNELMSNIKCATCGTVGKFVRLKQNIEVKPIIQCVDCSTIYYA